jgi:hypothetical protein
VPFSEALVEAGRLRFRPIVMTALAAILALLPLALGIGQGASMQQPLAIAIIASLVLQGGHRGLPPDVRARAREPNKELWTNSNLAVAAGSCRRS